MSAFDLLKPIETGFGFVNFLHSLFETKLKPFHKSSKPNGPG